MTRVTRRVVGARLVRRVGVGRRPRSWISGRGQCSSRTVHPSLSHGAGRGSRYALGEGVADERGVDSCHALRGYPGRTVRPRREPASTSPFGCRPTGSVANTACSRTSRTDREAIAPAIELDDRYPGRRPRKPRRRGVEMSQPRTVRGRRRILAPADGERIRTARTRRCHRARGPSRPRPSRSQDQRSDRSAPTEQPWLAAVEAEQLRKPDSLAGVARNRSPDVNG
jgi:hypothetical protein